MLSLLHKNKPISKSCVVRFSSLRRFLYYFFAISIRLISKKFWLFWSKSLVRYTLSLYPRTPYILMSWLIFFWVGYDTFTCSCDFESATRKWDHPVPKCQEGKLFKYTLQMNKYRLTSPWQTALLFSNYFPCKTLVIKPWMTIIKSSLPPFFNWKTRIASIRPSGGKIWVC